MVVLRSSKGTSVGSSVRPKKDENNERVRGAELQGDLWYVVIKSWFCIFVTMGVFKAMDALSPPVKASVERG